MRRNRRTRTTKRFVVRARTVGQRRARAWTTSARFPRSGKFPTSADFSAAARRRTLGGPALASGLRQGRRRAPPVGESGHEIRPVERMAEAGGDREFARARGVGRFARGSGGERRRSIESRGRPTQSCSGRRRAGSAALRPAVDRRSGRTLLAAELGLRCRGRVMARRYEKRRPCVRPVFAALGGGSQELWGRRRLPRRD